MKEHFVSQLFYLCSSPILPIAHQPLIAGGADDILQPIYINIGIKKPLGKGGLQTTLEGEALQHLQTGDEDKQSHSFSTLSKPPRGSNQSSDTFGYILITGPSQTNSSGH